MSLSNHDDGQFKPFDVSTLQSFDKEPDNLKKGRTPDLDRFKVLFEKSAFESDESNQFEALYIGEPKTQRVVFEPLIKTDTPPEQGMEAHDFEPGESLPAAPEEPEETPDEKGFREGFESGYAEGVTQGREQGYKEGFEQGEALGLKEGETKGFEKGEAEGRQEGMKTGEEAAQRETREKAVPILQSLETELQDAQNLIPSLVAKYETRIIDLIRQIAQKAVLASVEMDDEVVKSMVLDAMKSLVEPEQVILTVSEADYEYIEMVKDDFFSQIESLERISVNSDPTVPRGGCKIQTNTATVETDPQQRLDSIFEAIKNSMTVS